MVFIVNVSDPQHRPLHVNFDTNESFVHDIAVSGNYAYEAKGLMAIL
jgi:hypothetical protein